MEKAKSTFLKGIIFKAFLFMVKPNHLMEYLYLMMGHIIEVKFKIHNYQEKEDLYQVLVQYIKVNGKITSLKVRANKHLAMEINI